MTNAALAERAAAKHHIVLIADDHVLVRDGIKMLVARMLGTVRIFEVGDGDALFAALRRTARPHLALIDVQMPGMHGGGRLPELARRHPEIPLVVVSALDSAAAVRRVMSIPSVYACVPKTADREMMRSAIHAAMQGTKLRPAQGHARSAQPEVRLTPRQEEIRSLLGQGLRNKMIARILGISEGTVKNHITEIFRALKATNRTQVAQLRW